MSLKVRITCPSSAKNILSNIMRTFGTSNPVDVSWMRLLGRMSMSINCMLYTPTTCAGACKTKAATGFTAAEGWITSAWSTTVTSWSGSCYWKNWPSCESGPCAAANKCTLGKRSTVGTGFCKGSFQFAGTGTWEYHHSNWYILDVEYRAWADLYL